MLPLALALATLVLYWPSIHFDFVQYDDNDYVFDNQTVRAGLTWWGLIWSFVDAHALNWHPVTWLSHMLDCQLFGLNPGAHHLVNVLLHCANSALLFVLLRKLTGAVWRSLLVAALFAWHPLRVESVAWISERKDVLSGFFFMLTLLAYTRYAKTPHLPRRLPELNSEISNSTSRLCRPWNFRLWTLDFGPRTYYALALTFFALGLLAKPMLVTVPFILLLLDLWPLRRLPTHPASSIQHPTSSIQRPASSIQRPASSIQHPASSIQHPASGIRHLVCEKLPFFALSLAIAIITFFSQRSGGAVVSLRSEGFASRITTALAGYLGYLEKTFWPRDLTVIYLRPDSLPALTIILAVAILLTITLWAMRGTLDFGLWTSDSGVRRRTLHSALCTPHFIGWLWFLIMLLPVCGLVQVGPQLIADRYTYLPSIGLAILLAWTLPAPQFSILKSPRSQQRLQTLAFGPWTLDGWPVRRLWPLDLGLWTMAAAALVICAVLTSQQLAYWRNTDTLMTHALAVDPNNYIAHQDLAVYYSKLGQIDAARAHRQKVRELDPALR